jgi:hypothetical protein
VGRTRLVRSICRARHYQCGGAGSACREGSLGGSVDRFTGQTPRSSASGDTDIMAGTGGRRDEARAQPAGSLSRRRRRRLIVLCAAMAILSLFLVVAVGNLPQIDYEGLADSVRDFVLDWAWLLPLLAAAWILLLTTTRARRLLPKRRHRIAVGVLLTAAVFALPAALGPVASLATLGLAVGAALLFAWIFIIPQRIAPPLSAADLDQLKSPRDVLELKDGRTKLQNDIRSTALQTLAGLAVIVGALLAFQQLRDDRQTANATRELTLQGQASERFTRAIDQLGSNRTEVQLGGIYGLEQIAEQAPDNRPAVTEVLVAFLHRRTPRRNTRLPAGEEDLRLRAPEVHAALTVLMRRTGRQGDARLDLRNLDLRGAQLFNTNVLTLEHGSISDAGLYNTDLTGTDLRDAEIVNIASGDTIFDRASLCGANFESAYPFVTTETTFDPAPEDFNGAFADSATIWPDIDDFNSDDVEVQEPKNANCTD